jgi:hypothetical protein
MEARVERLESDPGEIRSILGRLAPRIDEMHGRLQAMPTTWQIVGIIAVMNAGIIGAASLVYAIFR